MHRIQIALVVALGACVGFVGCGEDDEFDLNQLVSSDGGFGAGGGGGGGGGIDREGIPPATPDECPPRDSDTAFYESEDPATCRDLEISCASGTVAFYSSCGCGCAERDLTCPNAVEARYESTNAAQCEGEPTCYSGEEGFFDACGCGCLFIDQTQCDPSKFFDETDDSFAAGDACGELVACLEIDEVNTVTEMQSEFPGTLCSEPDGSGPCGPSAGVECSASRTQLSAREVEGACSISTRDPVLTIGCTTR